LFLILTQALYTTTNIIFQVKLRYDLSNISYVIGSLVILVLVVVLSLMKVSIVWIAFTYVAGGVVIFILNTLFISRFGIISKLKFDKEISKPLFFGALPLGLMFIFSQVNFKADTLLMSVLPIPQWLGLNNTESIALYGLPYKVFEVALVVPTFFMNSVYPVMVKRMTVGKDELMGTFTKTTLFLMGAGIIVGAVGYLFAPFIIRFLGGGGFERSVTVLRILLAGLVVFYTTQPISWLIVTLGGQRYLPWVYLISAMFNVGANLVFIPKYAFYGSSVITILSELIILVLLVAYARKVWHQVYA
jgi:O-antigen/teichoic acid export membrane protein